MEFFVLGPLEVTTGDTSVEIAGSKRKAVLALLVLRANEVVRTELMIEALWGEQPPRNATAALHSHVSRLRKAVGPDVLVRREWGYVLRAPEETIDVCRFERLLAEADPLPARERSAKLGEALDLWRGPPLADLAHEPALERDIARLEELRLMTLERRIDADLETGRNSELVTELETLIAANPLREHLRWQLILSLYRADRQAEALEVYRETRRVLAEELGLDPSPALKELEKAILRQDPSLALSDAPSPTIPLPDGRSRSGRGRVYVVAIGLLTVGLAGAATAFVLADSGHSNGRSLQAASTITELSTISPEATLETTTSNPKSPGRPANAPPPRTNSQRVPEAPTTQATTTSTVTMSTPATTSPVPKTRPPPPTSTTDTTTTTPPKIVTISDSFDGDYVDGTIWQQIVTDSNLAIAEQGGQLMLTVGAAAVPGGQYNGIDVHVGTQCRFPGDFDARVGYALLEWPAGDNVFVGLSAIYADSGIGRQNSSQWGDQYTGWVVPSGGSVALPDTTGSLRVKRVKGLETTYFWHKGGWHRLAVGSSRGSAVFGLGAMWFGNNGQNPPFGHQEAKIAFDNFSVTGADPICPPGSEPPGG